MLHYSVVFVQESLRSKHFRISPVGFIVQDVVQVSQDHRVFWDEETSKLCGQFQFNLAAFWYQNEE